MFLERVMQKITDVTDLQSHARADFLIGQILGELEPDQFAAAFVEGFQSSSRTIPAPSSRADDFVGQRLGCRACGFGVFGVGVGGGGGYRSLKSFWRIDGVG